MYNLTNEIERRLEAGVLVVLKGFTLEECGSDRVDIQSVLDNKIMRVLSLCQQPKQIISYEEFIILYDFLLAQYKRIYVIENAIFWHLYPILVNIDENKKAALVAHFDPENEEEDSVDLSEYTQFYSNFATCENGYVCCYNLEEHKLRNEKIERIVLGETGNSDIEKAANADTASYLNICDQLDYYQLVCGLMHTTNTYVVAWDGYCAGKEAARNRIEVLNANFPNRIFSSSNASKVTPINARDDIRQLLKKHWGYDSFRTIKMYDVEKIDEGKKEVIDVSQEKIINDIVDQVEHCQNKQAFRDVFVTAPTGAGKSLMFQIPAMYIAEKYNLVTLVITPLISLMRDQVDALEAHGYMGARTINSDMSPIIKQEILDEISAGTCNLLYLSPESLLSRSDMQQLIGTRKIGMIVIDEAHIVTTWGKQFRPDYWYLGDHVQKWRRMQAKLDDPSAAPFIIATFTATAIYGGSEDMYHETINSMHMIEPITYLGYVKRENIAIEVKEVELVRNRTEYEINKFDTLVAMIRTALMRNQKTLIYFPTVALITRFYDYCYSKGLSEYVSKFHGQLLPEEKEESLENFRSGKKQVMLATKAFGMGIDIPDIAIVSHFAPTGNVCDYMQEIGRAARKATIDGHAIYSHMPNDFKHINRLHGLSAIQRYQLVEVMKKILELYHEFKYTRSNAFHVKSRNAMLIDTECFSYIFSGSQGDESDLTNKVKTAMLLIQKDYENRGFAPFYMRPIPMFAYGFFALSKEDQAKINRRYPGALTLESPGLNVCKVDLKSIWEQSYQNTHSFPAFKYLLYTAASGQKLDENQRIDLIERYKFTPAMSVDISFDNETDHASVFYTTTKALKELVQASQYQGKFYSIPEIVDHLAGALSISPFKAENIVNIVLAAMDQYRKNYSKQLNAVLYQSRVSKNQVQSYQFTSTATSFFGWLDKNFKYIDSNIVNGQLYCVNTTKSNRCKEITTVLGLLEAFGVLRFKSLGGSNSQIYINVRETKNMQIVRDTPNRYRNKLLELINDRHHQSVEMLQYLFHGKFESAEIWEHLENYFLGIMPPALSNDSNSITIDDETAANLAIQLCVGENLQDDYENWALVGELFDNPGLFEELNRIGIPLADYYGSTLTLGDIEADALLVWADKHLAITSGDEDASFRDQALRCGWKCITLDDASSEQIQAVLNSD